MNNFTEHIINAKRIVFKFGTNVLRNDEKDISLSHIYSFIEDIAKLVKQGKEVIVVTSGAVGLGAKRLKVNSNENIATKQACAAVGQGQLLCLYEGGFDQYGITTAQILLTEDDFSKRHKYLSLRNTMHRLLELNVVPIINQNDTVSIEELELYRENLSVSFSDNDKLSALVASKLDADLLVILSDIDGFFDSNPKTNPEAKLINVVEKITPSIEKLAQGASEGGRGGMKTKIAAAKVVTRSGGYAIIANGNTPNIIRKIFNGETTGTIFLPEEHLSGKKRWIAYATNIKGGIIVNEGAKKALIENETSLLPVGVVDVKNDFAQGEVVSIFDESGNEFARGLVNYSCKDVKKIMGCHSERIIEILGHKNHDFIIGKDNLAIL